MDQHIKKLEEIHDVQLGIKCTDPRHVEYQVSFDLLGQSEVSLAFTKDFLILELLKEINKRFKKLEGELKEAS